MSLTFGGAARGVAQAITGLVFPSNDVSVSNANSVRFKFTGTALIPIYGTSGAGVTYLWKYQPIQQTGYYSSFFWANDDEAGTVADTFQWNGSSAGSYYGCHPYPHDGTNPLGSSGTVHRWEISIEEVDTIDADDAVVKATWYSQALIAWGAEGVAKQHEFYWNLPDVTSSNRVTHTAATTWGDTAPPSPALTFGDAPWQPSVERASGIMRGWQIYDAKLTTTQINILEACDTDAEVLAAVSANSIPGLWYLNMNPADTGDISDKSGEGHHPAWFNANRPTLWEQ